MKWPFPNNWTEKYEAYCDGETKRLNGKTMVLLINTVICFVFLSMTDLLGRVKVTFLTNTMIITGLLIATFVNSFYLKLIGLSIAFGSEGTFSALFTIIINEFSSKIHYYGFLFGLLILLAVDTPIRSTATTGCFLAYGLGSVAINVVSLFVKNSDTLMESCFGLIVISVVPCYLLVKETPKYLY